MASGNGAAILVHNGFDTAIDFLYYNNYAYDDKLYADAARTVEIKSIPIPKRPGFVFGGYLRRKKSTDFYLVDALGNFHPEVIRYAESGPYTAQGTQTAASVFLDRNDGSASGCVVWKKIGDNVNIYAGPLVGDTISSVGIPVWPGHRFLGYYSAASGGTQCTDANGSFVVNASQIGSTLYAQWEDAAQFGNAIDYFNLASSALVPIASDSGDVYKREAAAHFGKYESGVNVTSGGIWRNPTVTYAVKADTTVAVKLGQSFAGITSGSADHVSGYMITAVEIVTEIGRFPTVTVSAIANEGLNAVNNFAANANAFNVSVPVVARSKAQNLLGAISGGGYLQRVTLLGTCDPVVCEENLMPCASDIVNGRFELAAETLAANGEAAPTMAAASGTSGGFALTGVPRVWRDCDYIRYAVEARKEMV